ncbi:cyclin [Moniliophthora roreri MCA 2997]|uniref:Cyclin n=2 Tax=Moniliophthora roreri TaxID=221103 RepID=V2XP79_MONRO|nr:cyclin [Moniliophthora roreri MCA 2997]KAI3604697.1 cyclin [Moniliophthora roreri]
MTAISSSAKTIDSQWIFPLSALRNTPTPYPVHKFLYDLARGVEFLYRLGTSLKLPSPALFTAATWLHRFYMRYSMEDFHRQDVAAACIFLATKTEECGRKLRDVARVYHSKVSGIDVTTIAEADDSPEVDQYQSNILLTEEYLLEAICFDFTVESPHAELVDLFYLGREDYLLQDYAWSLAHDSYRTPICLLYPPRITATACYVLAQRLVDGPNSPSLDARISFAAPSASLPTPPSHKAASPDESRLAIDHFALSEDDLRSVSGALSVLLEFYSVQDMSSHPYLSAVASIPPPTLSSGWEHLYTPPDPDQVVAPASASGPPTSLNGDDLSGRTPSSTHGDSTPAASQPGAPPTTT